MLFFERSNATMCPADMLQDPQTHCLLPTGQTLLIRDALQEDMAAIQAIYAEQVLTGLASFEETAPDISEITRRFQALIENNMPYLVAILNKTVVGFAYAGPFRTRSAFRYTVEDSIYLDVDYRDKGIGSHLLSTLMARCTALGFRQMVAVISGGRNQGSLALHKKLGFFEAGVLPAVGYKHAQWVDNVIMQAPLGEGQNSAPLP